MKNFVTDPTTHTEDNSKEPDFKCGVCGSRELDFFTRKKSCDLYRCRQCDFIFVYPAPGKLTEIYTEDYFVGAKRGSGYVDYEKEKEAMSATVESYLDEIEKLMPSPSRGKILDVGAATGTFLEAALRRGWQVSGVEISDYAASKARQKNLNVQTGILEDRQFKDAPFDVITMWDVLEHLPNPGMTLKLANGLLKPGGLIAFNTPNAGSFFAKLMGKHWHLIVPPEHLSYFGVDNLTKLLSKTGFGVRRVTYLGKKYTLQYVSKMLASWYGFFWLKWLANKMNDSPLGRMAVSIRLHDNLFLIAEKQNKVSNA